MLLRCPGSVRPQGGPSPLFIRGKGFPPLYAGEILNENPALLALVMAQNRNKIHIMLLPVLETVAISGNPNSGLDVEVIKSLRTRGISVR